MGCKSSENSMGLYRAGKYNHGLLFTNTINIKYSFHWILNYKYQAWRREGFCFYFLLIQNIFKAFNMQFWCLQVFLLQVGERNHNANIHHWLCSEIMAQTKGNAYFYHLVQLLSQEALTRTHLWVRIPVASFLQPGNLPLTSPVTFTALLSLCIVSLNVSRQQKWNQAVSYCLLPTHLFPKENNQSEEYSVPLCLRTTLG